MPPPCLATASSSRHTDPPATVPAHNIARHRRNEHTNDGLCPNYLSGKIQLTSMLWEQKRELRHESNQRYVAYINSKLPFQKSWPDFLGASSDRPSPFVQRLLSRERSLGSSPIIARKSESHTQRSLMLNCNGTARANFQHVRKRKLRPGTRHWQVGCHAKIAACA